jgi:hypothetical protein
VLRHLLWAIFELSLLGAGLSSALWIQSYLYPLRLRNNSKGCLVASRDGYLDSTYWFYPRGFEATAIADMRRFGPTAGESAAGWDQWHLKRSVGSMYVPGVADGAITFWPPAQAGIEYWEIALPCSIIAWLAHRAGRRCGRKRQGLCTVCGYDLRASPERCPECGTSIRKLDQPKRGR